MHIESGAPSRRRLISLTPLIDVVFILLVFFMLASTFMEWRLIDLQIGGEGGGEVDPSAARVHLTAEGIRHEDRLWEADELLPHLEEEGAERIRVEMSEGVALQRAVDLVARLRTLPGASVSLAGGAE
ncbi:biopolymer transport protein ExbD [Thiohalospira halophila DSM 15071]|uniref:Biopolymer transport protein ExbD n=1 Tax=Thiohalospira halophila DSM 15071 TaxID=1123397 RepID=A0A1I1UVI3_9GAMM|nr:biopolymer transporter ExbD [Thiohalospira halophila]SFD74585.1 biopolymer transport protein ExbD [Thiohalospira halophila DSM 15071]